MLSDHRAQRLRVIQWAFYNCNTFMWAILHEYSPSVTHNPAKSMQRRLKCLWPDTQFQQQLSSEFTKI